MDILVEDRYSFDLNTAGAVKALYDLTQQLEFYQKSIDKAQKEGADFTAQQRELIAVEQRLVAILNQETNTYSGMAAKRQILAEVQRNLTKGTREYAAVAKQVNELDKRIINTETGRAAKMQELRGKLKGLEEGTRAYAQSLRELQILEGRAAASTAKLTKGSGSFAGAVTGALAGVGIVVGIQQAIQLGQVALEASSQKLQQKNALLFALRGQEDIQERLLAQADAIEQRTLVDDDDIIALDRYLASLGLTEKQIKTLNEASVQYSAVTGKSVRASADALIAAQNGQIRGIAKFVPEVRGLTKAQLASGEAADLVSKKFAGSAEALTTGIVGAKNELKDFSESVKEGLGDSITKGIGGLASTLKNTFGNIFAGFQDEAKTFIGEFVDEIFLLPANLVATVNGIVEVIKALFNGTLANFERTSIRIQEGYLDLKEAIFGGLDTEDLLKSSKLAGQKVALNLSDPFANGVGIIDIFSNGVKAAFKDAGDFAKGFAATGEEIDNNPFLPKTKAEVKILAGSLQDLENQVSKLREFLSKGVIATDEAALLPLLKQIDELEKRIKAAKALQKELLNPTKSLTDIEQAEAGLKSLGIDKIDSDENKARAKEELDKLAKSLAGSVGVKIPVEIDQEEAAKEFEIQKHFLEEEQRIRDANAAKKKAQHEEILEILDATASLATQVASAIGDVFDRQEQRTTAAVEKQKSSLADALSNSEDFTAEQIELERQRLDKLEKQQKAATERAKTAQLIQVAINTIVAVTKAASQTGVGAPIAILTTLGAIAAGIAAANSLAGNAFWEGTDYVQQGNHPHGRDTIPARLTKGEAVLDVDDNRNYHPTVKAIRRHMIPAKVLNDFVQSYRGGSQMPRTNLGSEGAALAGGSSNNFYFNAKLTKLEREAEAQTRLLSSIERQGRGQTRSKKSSAGQVSADRFR